MSQQQDDQSPETTPWLYPDQPMRPFVPDPYLNGNNWSQDVIPRYHGSITPQMERERHETGMEHILEDSPDNRPLSQLQYSQPLPGESISPELTSRESRTVQQQAASPQRVPGHNQAVFQQQAASPQWVPGHNQAVFQQQAASPQWVPGHNQAVFQQPAAQPSVPRHNQVVLQPSASQLPASQPQQATATAYPYRPIASAESNPRNAWAQLSDHSLYCALVEAGLPALGSREEMIDRLVAYHVRRAGFQRG